MFDEWIKLETPGVRPHGLHDEDFIAWRGSSERDKGQCTARALRWSGMVKVEYYRIIKKHQPEVSQETSEDLTPPTVEGFGGAVSEAIKSQVNDILKPKNVASRRITDGKTPQNTCQKKAVKSAKKTFQVGDKITCLFYGKGIVKSIIPIGVYPMQIYFGELGRFFYYTMDGRLTSESRQSLFEGHGTFNIEFIEDKEPTYVWQWLKKNIESDVFDTSDYYSNEEEAKSHVERSGEWKLLSRIEESKKVKK